GTGLMGQSGTDVSILWGAYARISSRFISRQDYSPLARLRPTRTRDPPAGHENPSRKVRTNSSAITRYKIRFITRPILNSAILSKFLFFLPSRATNISGRRRLMNEVV